jgi:hypothetical protein
MNSPAQKTRRVIFGTVNVLVCKAANFCRFFYDVPWIMAAAPRAFAMPPSALARAER